MAIIKFESESNAVKGLAFHPTRPWILSTQYSGLVELYDYRFGILVRKFDEHSGPVRGCDFHPTRPIFVTGGDDLKIKVWDYKQEKCLFTLLGHADYVRTTFFHRCQPWIVSASDDGTVRIWNWQSRECIAVLAGHTHYVMCAQFHPSEKLVVSGSLDQTIRVWTISSLFEKNAPVGVDLPSLELLQEYAGGGAGEGVKQAPNFSKIHEVNILGRPDGAVKHIIQAHEGGVNWVSFHPTLPIIVSASEDHRVKLWRFDESMAWEVDTCRGHHSEVRCAIFHPSAPFILSVSKDGSVRVWDAVKRTCLESFYHGSDKFWSLAAHPTTGSLFAAGHDGGLMVFKLQRERPPYCVRKNHVLYIKDRQLRLLDFEKRRDVAVVELKPHKLFQPYYSVEFGENDSNFIVTTRPHNVEESCFDTYSVAKKGKEGAIVVAATSRYAGIGAVWVGRNQIAVLDKSRQLSVREEFGKQHGEKVELETVKNRLLDIFSAGPGCVLLREGDVLHKCDVLAGSVLSSSTEVGKVKYVVWSDKMEFAALLGGCTLTIVDANMKVLCSVEERTRVKSGAWDNDAGGVFVYTSASHLKFALTNGECGVIRTLDVPIYLLAIRDSTAFCFDKSAAPFEFPIDSTEYRFKLALINGREEEVEEMVASANLVGHSLLAYIHSKGHSEMALKYVKDESNRFSLALDCGNLDEALKSAEVVDDPGMWQALAKSALSSNNLSLVETAYLKSGDLESLAFLYLISGNIVKLREMAARDDVKEQVHLIYQISLGLGDAGKQVEVLKSAGQPLFAYLSATTNGMKEEAEEIKKQLDQQQIPTPLANPNATPFKPPEPVSRHSFDAS